ncbi:HNH endonuclease signature motif containing protein [bacterium endosymbiont of Bathymodiolus sp. 5 South]|jgi:endonuclease I|uniref:HNH endonuclease signature motif containing protein n=1 Tax=bacterium endosymbiont of Bathymodiolus sp. 5 South TaxID=1181670 RepID=UPI0010B90DEF|nr:endonuclease [bacterium endosymbiont of Bathymodiolus sp. 5 South]CAC9461333.1 Endonuclease I [uncultured Gammaproteobacteria bacterium]SHN91077.1 Endonuclease I [bacterium endosymbiont of Bathymodiolus sp. 5 South]SSC08212.1 Endonuclease I [bacterium endosymbiont of Bathymodiolus sp. 5 South]VVH54892.1 Endonuclease I [uncultured Gammaproteobacteria bacterium]VVH61891.1 Endonuclease I [uncultured Gammaproteobacteria bacterium]
MLHRLYKKILVLVFSVTLVTLYGCSSTPVAKEAVTGEPLREQLFHIISKHKVLKYRELWKAFKQTDALPNQPDKVFDIYSYNGDNTAYIYKFFTDQCGHYKKEGDCYNREHSFPKTWWGGSLNVPMATDLYHIYPTDGYVNNMRAAYPYAGVVNSKKTKFSTNKSKMGRAQNKKLTGKFFEPIDEFKGDLARGYFYLLTAYYDKVQDWHSPILTGNNFTPWAQKILLKWHKQDPVSDKERRRNKQIMKIQGNYNPFIVSPKLVGKIWKDN